MHMYFIFTRAAETQPNTHSTVFISLLDMHTLYLQLPVGRRGTRGCIIVPCASGLMPSMPGWQVQERDRVRRNVNTPQPSLFPACRRLLFALGVSSDSRGSHGLSRQSTPPWTHLVLRGTNPSAHPPALDLTHKTQHQRPNY